jgi:hypothetical protein
MELKNIIFHEVKNLECQKLHVFSHMWNIDLIQIWQFYEKDVTLRKVADERGRVKKEVKVNMIDHYNNE